MGRLYSDGKVKVLTTVVSEVVTYHTTTPQDMEIDWLINEHCDTLLIEGHVDLDKAEKAFLIEGGSRFPAPRHTYMRYMKAPDDEAVEPEDRFHWRGGCRRGDRGAEPVTISVCPT